MPYRFACLILAAASLAGASHKDGSYIDLRLQGGLVADDGLGAGLTFMAAAIPSDGRTRNSTYADVGLALGVRAVYAQGTISDVGGADQDVDLTGGSVLGGFSFRFGRNVNLEFLAAVGKGWTSSDGPTFDSGEGEWTGIGGEVGCHYTRDDGWQFGVVAGWTRRKVTSIVATIESEDDVEGFDLALSAGWRF